MHYEKFQDETIKCIEDEIPFEVPEGWAWCRLRNICMMSAGKAKPTAYIKTEPFEGSFECYGGNGVRGYIDEYNYEGTYSIVGRQGALCGNINIASGKFYATEHAVVTTLFSGIDFFWNNYILEALELNKYATGAAQPGLSVANVLNILIAIPPAYEQIQIAKRINSSLENVSVIIAKKTQLQETIIQCKSKILDLAIRGKLVPQDPTDEPASVLLERIRAEKEELIKQGKIKRDKNDSVIYKGDDNSYYEKIGNKVVCINEEIPFELPDNWMFVRLKSIWQLLSGRDLAPSEYNSNSEGIPYITGASNFSNGSVAISRWTTTPQVISETGDLLLTCKGTVGEIAFNDFGNAHIARQIMAIRNIFNLDSEYMELCIRYYLDLLITSAKGLIPGISREDILNLILPIPPQQYQTRLVLRMKEIDSAVTITLEYVS